jgi:hypothetical protein
MTQDKSKMVKLAGAAGLVLLAVAFVAWRVFGGPSGPSDAELKAEQKSTQLTEEASKQPGFVKTMPDPVEKPPPGKNRAPTDVPK